MVSGRVKKVISEVIERRYKRTEVLESDMLLENDLGLDSLDFVEVWCSLEEEFLIKIPKEHEQSSFRTVSDVIKIAQTVIDEQEIARRG